MDNPTRSRPRRAFAPFLLPLILGLAVAVAPAPPARAQESGETSGQSEASRKEEKERAKQARIEEYLRKKEERLARKELRRAEKEQVRQVGASVAAEATAPQRKTAKKDRVVLPRGLAEAQAVLRKNPIAEDPTVAAYLDLIDRAEASPHQLAAFGNFLSDLGMNRLALEYYAVALSIEREDPVLWINVGTLHRQLGEFSPALAAYSRALAIDPNLAVAHYNLGAVLDEQGKYEEALEEYRVALTLDPSLGDPAVNPQAANNERLVAVKLMLYKQQTGSLGLPLVEIRDDEPAAPLAEED